MWILLLVELVLYAGRDATLLTPLKEVTVELADIAAAFTCDAFSSWTLLPLLACLLYTSRCV